MNLHVYVRQHLSQVPVFTNFRKNDLLFFLREELLFNVIRPWQSGLKILATQQINACYVINEIIPQKSL